MYVKYFIYKKKIMDFMPTIMIRGVAVKYDSL